MKRYKGRPCSGVLSEGTLCPPIVAKGVHAISGYGSILEVKDLTDYTKYNLKQ